MRNLILLLALVSSFSLFAEEDCIGNCASKESINSSLSMPQATRILNQIQAAMGDEQALKNRRKLITQYAAKVQERVETNLLARLLKIRTLQKRRAIINSHKQLSSPTQKAIQELENITDVEIKILSYISSEVDAIELLLKGEKDVSSSAHLVSKRTRVKLQHNLRTLRARHIEYLLYAQELYSNWSDAYSLYGKYGQQSKQRPSSLWNMSGTFLSVIERKTYGDFSFEKKSQRQGIEERKVKLARKKREKKLAEQIKRNYEIRENANYYNKTAKKNNYGEPSTFQLRVKQIVAESDAVAREQFERNQYNGMTRAEWDENNNSRLGVKYSDSKFSNGLDDEEGKPLDACSLLIKRAIEDTEAKAVPYC